MKLIIDIKVSDLERAVSFYTNVLGLVLRVQEKEWAAISVGDAEIHLYLNGGVTGSVEFYVADLDSVVEKLKENSVEIIPGDSKPGAIEVDGGGVTKFPWGRTAFFKDSEGNELAFVRDFK